MSNPTGEGSKVAQGASQPPPGKWGIPEELAADRNRMASENNLLGWIRTSLAMISFGFGLAKFFEYLQVTQPQRATRLGQGPIYIGWFLLILGTFLILVAALIHWRRLKLLEQGEIFSRSRWSLGLVVAFLLFGLGFFALVSHFFMF